MAPEAQSVNNFRFAEPPKLSDILKCTHCGLCLNQCPTYRVLGWEMDSPRGRVRLMRGVTEGLFQVTPTFAMHMDVCLACRACETACPASINFGQMVEAARAQALQTVPLKPLPRFLRWVVFKQLFPFPKRLNLVAALVRLYQRTRLQKLSRSLHLIPPTLRDSEALLPPLPDAPFGLGRVIPAFGEKRGRVAFFAGCVMSTVYADTNSATVRVLARNGFEVVIPDDQICCGALAIHAGERATAQDMAKKNIDTFLNLTHFSPYQGAHNLDAIIVNAAGCGVALKEYGELLESDPVYAEKARQFSHLMQDATEFLAARGIRQPAHSISARITFQDPCHLAHGQGIRAQPRALLNQIPGVQLVEMRDTDRCCGSAGIYNITHPDLSALILDEKMQNIGAVRPDIIVTANVGCLLQLQQGIRKTGLKAEIVHIMDLLDRAYGSSI